MSSVGYMRVSEESLYIFTGFLLVMGGWLLVFLMVIRIISPDMLLSLFAYAISLVGLVLGFYGLFTRLVTTRKKASMKVTQQSQVSLRLS